MALTSEAHSFGENNEMRNPGPDDVDYDDDGYDLETPPSQVFFFDI